MEQSIIRRCPRNCDRRVAASICHWASAWEGEADRDDPGARRPAWRSRSSIGRGVPT